MAAHLRQPWGVSSQPPRPGPSQHGRQSVGGFVRGRHPQQGRPTTQVLPPLRSWSAPHPAAMGALLFGPTHTDVNKKNAFPHISQSLSKWAHNPAAWLFFYLDPDLEGASSFYHLEGVRCIGHRRHWGIWNCPATPTVVETSPRHAWPHRVVSDVDGPRRGASCGDDPKASTLQKYFGTKVRGEGGNAGEGGDRN